MDRWWTEVGLVGVAPEEDPTKGNLESDPPK